MKLTFSYLVCAAAVLLMRVADGQNVVGTNIRVKPSTVPGFCNTGDIRVDQDDNFKLKTCRNNVWITMLDSSFSGTGSIGAGSADTVLSSDGTNIVWQKILNVNVDSTAAIAYGKLNLTASIVNADVGAAAGIVDTKLGTISTSGKVLNSATTATPVNTTSAIVARDASGNFTAGTIFAALTGTASQAGTASFATTASSAGLAAFAGTASATTAFVVTPNPCGASQFASAIAANGNLTCSIVSTASQAGTAAFASSFNGTISIAQGGTNNGTLSTTAGGLLYMDGTRAMNMGAGTSGQSVRSAGSGTPVWRTTLAVISQYTTGSTVYTPSANALVIRIRGVAGGGGGSGSGSSAGGAGGVGGDTTIGTSFITAKGGGGGVWGAANCTSVTASVGTASYGFVKNGGVGSSGAGIQANGGGGGAASPFGAGGGGGYISIAGSVPAPNTGAGGGGGGAANVASNVAGSGGCSGAYFEAWINSPSINTTYTVGIGAAGTAGAAGVGGVGGGAGSVGYVVIEEFY